VVDRKKDKRVGGGRDSCPNVQDRLYKRIENIAKCRFGRGVSVDRLYHVELENNLKEMIVN